MGSAYQCDRCGKYFPSLPKNRWLPAPALTGNKASFSKDVNYRGTGLELCSSCCKNFDIRIEELHDIFLEASRKRPSTIKSDTGHEESVDIEMIEKGE